MGVAVSFLGMLLSYKYDTPTGATVICLFGLSLLLLGMLRVLLPQRFHA